MLTRRELVAVVGSGAIAGLAGCSGSNSEGSGTVDCHTHALAHGNGSALDTGASGTVEGEDVRLVIPLSVETVTENSIDTIEIYDATGALTHTIPVSVNDADLMTNKTGVSDGQLQYEQYLGQRPYHGEYRVVAVDETGSTVDSITIEFNCFSDVSNES